MILTHAVHLPPLLWVGAEMWNVQRRKRLSSLWQPLDPNEDKSTDSVDYR